ncbi:sensor histidine kinase [Thermodesulfatator atlanticus]|uniref:sensor histidine kinase n=1 Tax=Thermodesulfatator atlanticus TaxID=501497 RepID=UPI0003B55BCE|nr:HAMP domain-containing sensor histidine kinase [Thermodesulfatator atlanticus]
MSSSKFEGYKPIFLLALAVLILTTSIEVLYFRYFITEITKRESQSTLNFLEARLTAYVETLELLPEVPDYLKDLAWLTDELQGQPQLVGVLVKEKGKVLLNTFPTGTKFAPQLFKRCYQGLNVKNVRFVCRDFEALPDRKFFLLLGLDIGFAKKAFLNFVILSGCILLAASVLLGTGLFYLEKFSRRQKELEKQLSASEKLAAMGKISAMVAHEIRNPLNSIVMGLQYMSETQKISPEILDMIKTEAQKLTELTGELLSYAKGFEIHPQPVYAQEIIEELALKFKEKAKRQGIDLLIEKGPSQIILVDKRWCLRALENLIRNALEATPQGGEILLKFYVEGNEAIFEVKDTGSGISPKEQTRLFEPFFSTKSTGFGLGLYLVRKVAEAHAGRVSFSSEPKKGSVFRIHFPIKNEG